MSFRQIAQIPLDYDLFKGYDHPFNFSPSGSIRFGNGVIDETGMIVKELGAEKVVLCTDEGLVALGVAQRVISSLEAAGVDYKIFSKCEANPSV